MVAGGIFPKDEVEQQQLMYFKNKVFTITDTGWRPPQCIDIAPKKMMVWQKELIVLALQGMKFMHVFFYSLYHVYAVPIQDPLDNNTTEGIATNLGWNVPSKFMTKCCYVVTMVSMNLYISIMFDFERCQFKSLWKLMICIHIRFVNY